VQWADALAAVALDQRRRAEFARAAVRHAGTFSWDRTVDRLLETYVDAAAEFRTRQSEGVS